MDRFSFTKIPYFACKRKKSAHNGVSFKNSWVFQNLQTVLWLRRSYLALGNEKKSMLSFCISLVFSYFGKAEVTLSRQKK